MTACKRRLMEQRADDFLIGPLFRKEGEIYGTFILTPEIDD